MSCLVSGVAEQGEAEQLDEQILENENHPPLRRRLVEQRLRNIKCK